MKAAPGAPVRRFRLGDALITKVPELDLDEVDPTILFPGRDAAAALEKARQLGPASINGSGDRLRQSIHVWLIRAPGRCILIDTGAGNDKNRPGNPVLDHLQQPFLERLRSAGAEPEEVDMVLLTHLHADHVGWNTRLQDGHWVPTFRNARYLFSGRERAYNAALSSGDGADAIRTEAGLGPMVKLPAPGVFDDSVRPVIDAGLAHEVAVDGSEVVDGFAFHPTPGHSIDHACISFCSNGERALFWGDVMHHPIQFAWPEWNSVFCEFPEAARRARLWAIDHAATTGALVLTTHFADSSAGRVTQEGQHTAWQFEQPEVGR